jgi:hypothetical protein
MLKQDVCANFAALERPGDAFHIMQALVYVPPATAAPAPQLQALSDLS